MTSVLSAFLVALFASVPVVAGDADGDWCLGDMPCSSAFGCERGRMVLSNMQDLIIRATLPVADNGLDVLRLAEWCLHDLLTLIERRGVSTNNWAMVESRMAEVRRLEEHVRAAEDDSGVLCLAHARIDELTADRASFTAGTGQAMAEQDILAARIRKLEVSTSTPIESWRCGAGFGVLEGSRCSKLR